jgi:tetratricopeptide (TPR) repeat protein
MMFEKLNNASPKLSNQEINNFTSENTTVIPVTSLEEVAYHFRDSDENFRYEYFLMQVKQPLVKTTVNASQAVPPPFTLPNTTLANTETPATSQQAATQTNFTGATSSKTEKEDVLFLAENADLLLQAGEIELARNIYRAVLKTCEANDVAYAGLAACSDKEGLVEQAIQFAWDSVAFAPNRRGYQLLAQLLVQQGRDQEASQALTRALRSLELNEVEQADYHKMIGNCMSRLGQTAEAERAYKKALELSPASDEVQSNLGSLYLEQGSVGEAKRCYQDAIASNPQNDKAWVGLGLCCVAEGDKESAHESFARSLEKNLRNSTAIFHLVKCAYEIKKYSTAEKMLSNYVEMAPVSPSLLYSLAGLQFHVGKKKEATSTAKRILLMKGDHQGAKDLIKRIDTEAS